MNKNWSISWKPLTQALTSWGHRNATELMIGMGIAGGVGTVCLAISATTTAMAAIEEKKKREHRGTLTGWETVQTVWKCYIPTVTLGAISTGCVIGANTVSNKRNAALAAACQIAQSSLQDYQARTVEAVGEETHKKILETVDRSRMERDSDPKLPDYPAFNSRGQTLCYDAMFGRPFYSDRESLERVENELNRRMVTHGDDYISLNDFYTEIDSDDLPTVEIGDELGWNINRGLINLRFSSHLYKGRTPCLLVGHNTPPEYDYRRY